MPRRYAMQNRERATAEVRTRLLEATLDEIAAAGSDRIGLQDVAARADVALRTLYNHFAGRDQLFAAAFRQHTEQTRAAIEAVTVPDTDPRQQLLHVVQVYHRRYARMGRRLSVLLSLRGYPDLEEQVRAIRSDRSRLLTRIIERAHDDRTLKLPVPTAVALAYTLTSHAGWQSLREQVSGRDAMVSNVANRALQSALFHDGAAAGSGDS